MSDGRGVPAVFIDRDGTLNEPVGYVNHRSRFRLFPWSVDAIRLVQKEGYLAVVVTNQSGVGRGYFSLSLLEGIHAELNSCLSDAGLTIDGLYYCPHKPEDSCLCRKPKPGMILQARDELDIDLERSWMVGDSLSDLQAGWAAGTHAALVRTGFGEGLVESQKKQWQRPPDLIGENLYHVLCNIFWGS